MKVKPKAQTVEGRGIADLDAIGRELRGMMLDVLSGTIPPREANRRAAESGRRIARIEREGKRSCNGREVK